MEELIEQLRKKNKQLEDSYNRLLDYKDDLINIYKAQNERLQAQVDNLRCSMDYMEKRRNSDGL